MFAIKLILIFAFVGTIVVEGLGLPSKKVIGKQTWGYVEVRPGANMFWWLYYTGGVEDYTKVPLVLWLQGGPGASSTGYGNFIEIGPKDINLNNRTVNWVDHANVLFVDNPVGTGFSYVNDLNLLTTNNTQIAMDLVEMLDGFLQKVPEFQTIPLHIFSESYGGKMAAQFALRLYKFISKGKIKCNLKSVNLGDSWISPIDSVLTWAPFLFSTSLVDNVGFGAINKSAYSVKTALDNSDFKEATKNWDLTEGIVSTSTNGVSFYNILKTDSSSVSKNFLSSTSSKGLFGAKHLSAYHSDQLSALMNGEIKEMLRIIPANVSWGGQSAHVFDKLGEDFMKPVTRIVETLLNSTSVAVNVYNGQLDLIVDTMGTTRWVERLDWSGISNWKNSARKPIVIGNETGGFVKTFKNFGFYWILRAGHMVPADSPDTALQMLKMITSGTK